jgi:hypothetical protein
MVPLIQPRATTILLSDHDRCRVAAGAPTEKHLVQLRVRIKGVSFTLYGGWYSQEGGTESPFHVRRDALQLAAHELGAKRAKTSPRGVYINTAAGKEFFSNMRPFQKSKLAEWEDTAEAIKVITQDIELRTEEIYEQLLKWPQSPLAPLQGDM